MRLWPTRTQNISVSLSVFRSALERAAPGLRANDGRPTASVPPSPRVGSDPGGSDPGGSDPGGSDPGGGFLAFCRAQLQQTRDLEQQRHSRELR